MPGTPGRFDRRWRTAVREVGFIAAAALLYTLVRGLTDERVPVAFANADAVISFERGLGILVEPGLQAAVLEAEFVVDVVNAVYIGYWPIVVGALVWVLLRHPGHYPLYRNAVLTSAAVSLVIFALYPRTASSTPSRPTRPDTATSTPRPWSTSTRRCPACIWAGSYW